MLLSIYLACLIIGGAVLLTTVLFGGEHGSDAGVEADVQAELEAGAEVDSADLGHDVEVGHSLEHDIHGADHGGDAIWLPFFSLRFWVFFTTFFGLTGTILKGLSLTADVFSVLTSLVVGTVSGSSAAWVIHWLKRSETGDVMSENTFLGLEGQVYIPLDDHRKGKIRLELDGRIHDLSALNLEEGELRRGDLVTIVRVENDIAYVTRSDRLLEG